MRCFMTLLTITCLSPVLAAAQGWSTRMHTIDDYLLEESLEVALARSAAPAHVSGAAAILVMRRDGYERVHEGTNGFTCLVERSWSSPIGPHEDFFNPRLRAPICYNEEASRTILADYLRRTDLAMAGRSIGEIEEAIERDIGTGALRAPRGMAMSYMLSGGQLLGTNTGQFKPHLMFYIPYATAEQLGSPPPGCEHACMFEHVGGPLAAVIVATGEFIQVKHPSIRGR
jgi:hypothetical protein